MQFSARIRYSIRALIYLARRGEARPVTCEEISREENISRDFLERLLNKLKHEGLVKSIRGRRGGYLLSRPPQDITLEEVLRASGESLELSTCSDGIKGCPRRDSCLAFPFWRELREKFRLWLKEITLGDLISEDKNIRR